jgi:hypothetical protein
MKTGATAKRKKWTAAELSVLKSRDPDEPAIEVARALGASLSYVYKMAHRHGVKKSAAFLASDKAKRILRDKQYPAMIATRFQKGHTPANKGLRRPGWAPGRMAETQFKKGRLAHEARNYRPIGAERICRDGYLERKVSDDPALASARRWVAVHRLVWEAAHGPIPRDRIVVFRRGMATTVTGEITLDRLELITRQESMRRNTIHNLPQPLPQLIQLSGALKRKIDNRVRQHEEQVGRPA